MDVMKTSILAALIALGGATAIVPQTQAASLTITTDDGARYDNGQRYHNWDRYDRDNWRTRHAMRWGHDCHIRYVKHWHNHRVYVEKVRVCD